MSRSKRFHPHSDEKVRVVKGSEDLPLFQALTDEHRARDVERLVPLAKELARRAGRSGITVSDLRITAVQRGLLTGAEEGKRLAYLGSVMPAAGLVTTGHYRRSDVAKSHGNLHSVWVHPDYAEGAA